MFVALQGESQTVEGIEARDMRRRGAGTSDILAESFNVGVCIRYPADRESRLYFSLSLSLCRGLALFLLSRSMSVAFVFRISLSLSRVVSA